MGLRLILNKRKCKFFRQHISCLGYVISENKISKCPKQIEEIKNVPRPSSPEEVKRLLEMITYYSRFIPNTSSIAHPLRLLLKKGVKFERLLACEKAFNKLKEEIANETILMLFNPALPVS